MAAAHLRENPLAQNLQSRNSSKSERTLLDGTIKMAGAEQDKIASESSSQRSLTGAKNDSDVEAQSRFESPEPNEKTVENQDLNLVREPSQLWPHRSANRYPRSPLMDPMTQKTQRIGQVRSDGHAPSSLLASHSSLLSPRRWWRLVSLPLPNNST